MFFVPIARSTVKKLLVLKPLHESHLLVQLSLMLQLFKIYLMH